MLLSFFGLTVHRVHDEWFWICQGRSFTTEQIDKAMLAACGGDISSAYWQLRDEPISDAIYLIELRNELQEEWSDRAKSN